jgi:metal-responsive CopG/Arc/MetJ family transcriptional regulator
VKTAISIPDHVIEAAEQRARRLGKSRSELYADAIASYRDQHRDEGVTDRLNELYNPQKEEAELDSVLTTLQALSIPEEKW